jgi:hypothetical protein
VIGGPDVAEGTLVGRPYRPEHYWRVEEIRFGEGGRPPAQVRHRFQPDRSKIIAILCPPPIGTAPRPTLSS